MGLWNNIPKLCLISKKISPLKNRAENIFINCGGQKDLFVLDVVTEKPGPPEETRPDAANVIFKFLLLLALFSKIPGFPCVCGFVLYGMWLAKNMVSVLWGFNGFWDLIGMKQHGLCCTNCGLLWFVLVVSAWGDLCKLMKFI
jgi:hypothetical protein